MSINWTTKLKEIKKTRFNDKVHLYELNPDHR